MVSGALCALRRPSFPPEFSKMLKMFRSRLRQFIGRPVSSRRNRAVFRSTATLESLEDRALPSALSMFGTSVFYQPDAAATDDLTVSFNPGTGNYTFSVAATSAPLTASAGLAGSDLNPDPRIVEFNAAASGLTSITIDSGEAADVVRINSWRTGNEGVLVRAGAGSVTVGGSLGTTGDRIGGTVSITGASINLGAGIFTTNTTVTLNGPVTLTANADIDAGSGTVQIQNTIDGAFDLKIVGGFLDIDQAAVGSGTPLANYSATGNILATRSIATTGNVTLQSNTYILQGPISGGATMSLTQRTPGNNVILTFGSPSNPILGDFSGFTSVLLGDSSTGTLNINNDGIDGIGSGAGAGPDGNVDFGAPTTITANSVNISESINNLTHSVDIVTNSLAFGGQGSLLGSGAFGVTKLTVGSGTLNINSFFSRRHWGTAAATINAPGAAINVSGDVGANLTTLTMNAATITFNRFTAVTSQGNMTLTGNVTAGGGLFSQTGNIQVNGNLTLNIGATFLVGAGGSFTVTGSTAGNGNRMTIRGFGSINAVSLGSVTNVGAFQIDAIGTNTVNLASVQANNIVVRGTTINTNGTIQSTSGSLHLIGSVVLVGNTQLVYSGTSLNQQVRVDGTISSSTNQNLTVNSGNGRLNLNGAVNGVGDMTIVTKAIQFVTAPITVTGNFNWNSNGAAVTVQQDITANSIIFSVPPNLVNGAMLIEP